MRLSGQLFLAVITLMALLYIPLSAQAEGGEGHGHQHHGKHGMGSKSIEEYIAMFEDPSRAEWQKPEKVVEALALKVGDVVADLGAGSGYFSVLFSRRVGDKGRVYATDVEQGMVDYIKKRMEKEGLKNITPGLCEPDNPGLVEKSVDLLFICDTWHHIPEHPAYLQKIARALKSGGRLAIVDFKKEPTPEGPPLRMRLSREEVVHEVTKAGYALSKEFDFLPYQYFLIFTAKGEENR